MTVNEPQFVLKTSLYVFSGSRRSFGAVAPPSSRAAGTSTSVQPSAVALAVRSVVASVVGAVVVRRAAAAGRERARRREEHENRAGSAHRRILPRLTCARQAPVVLEWMTITLEVNGQRYTVEPDGRRLLAVLRDDLELLGTKLACGEGACGACAVLVDGRPVNSCLLLAEAAAGHEIVTIEGLSTGRAAARPGGVRRRGRAPVRLLHAGPDRQRDGAARADAAADPRADPRGDGGQPLPLRRVSEDRARDPARGG